MNAHDWIKSLPLSNRIKNALMKDAADWSGEMPPGCNYREAWLRWNCIWAGITDAETLASAINADVIQYIGGVGEISRKELLAWSAIHGKPKPPPNLAEMAEQNRRELAELDAEQLAHPSRSSIRGGRRYIQGWLDCYELLSPAAQGPQS